MPNKTSAIEWLRIAYHDLKSAQILFRADHYTDSIGNDLQQSIEKILKAILAYDNKRIKKSHDLVDIYHQLEEKFSLNEEEIDLLDTATEYFKEDRYPNPNYSLPSHAEIKEILEFTENLFEDVCQLLHVAKQELMR